MEFEIVEWVEPVDPRLVEDSRTFGLERTQHLHPHSHSIFCSHSHSIFCSLSHSIFSHSHSIFSSHSHSVLCPHSHSIFCSHSHVLYFVGSSDWELYESQTTRFTNFIIRANRYPVLQLLGGGVATSTNNKIVLVEVYIYLCTSINKFIIVNYFYRNFQMFSYAIQKFFTGC